MSVSRQSMIAASQEELDALVLSVALRQGQWEEDYLWLSDHASTLVEFTDGYIDILPIPTDHHQSILLFLYRLFFTAVELRGGKVLIAPLRLRIRSGKYRELDLLLRSAHDVRQQDRSGLAPILCWKWSATTNPNAIWSENATITSKGASPNTGSSTRLTKPSRYCSWRMALTSNIEDLGAASRRHRR